MHSSFNLFLPSSLKFLKWRTHGCILINQIKMSHLLKIFPWWSRNIFRPAGIFFQFNQINQTSTLWNNFQPQLEWKWAYCQKSQQHIHPHVTISYKQLIIPLNFKLETWLPTKNIFWLHKLQVFQNGEYFEIQL